MTLLLISRKGCESIDPFWMILMVPPCSTTKRRPLPSLACSSPKGELRPETSGVKVRLGKGEGEAEDELLHPALIRRNAVPSTAHPMRARRALAMVCTLERKHYDTSRAGCWRQLTPQSCRNQICT